VYVQLFARVAVKSIENGQVVVLASAGIGNYISAVPPGDMPECFLHSLATRSFSVNPVAPILPQPNLVTGLPAQGLTNTVLCWKFLPNIKITCDYCWRYVTLVIVLWCPALLSSSSASITALNVNV